MGNGWYYVLITNKLPFSLFLHRVGDILLSINGEEVRGKPISRVQEMIKSVPRGTVQLIAKASKASEQTTSNVQRSQSNKSLRNNLPFSSDTSNPQFTRSRNSIQNETSDFQPLPAPPPPVFADVGVDGSRTNGFLRKPSEIRDDVSDLESLPPAPPRPIMPVNPPPMIPEDTEANIVPPEQSFGALIPPPLYNDDGSGSESEVDSIFSALPPPPPKPATTIDVVPAGTSIVTTGGNSSSSSNANYGSDSTIRKLSNNSRSAASLTDSEDNVSPPPAPSRSLQGKRSSAFGSLIFPPDDNDSDGRRRSVDDINSFVAIPPPPLPDGSTFSEDATNSDSSGGKRLKLSLSSEKLSETIRTEASEELESPTQSQTSATSALNFLNTTLSHMDNFAVEDLNAKDNPRAPSPSVFSPPSVFQDQSHSDLDVSPQRSSSPAYGSYASLASAPSGHMPVIKGDHQSESPTESGLKKKGFLSRLKARFLSSNKSKLDDKVARDSKGRTIVHLSYEKNKSMERKGKALKGSSSQPNLPEMLDQTQEYGYGHELKRTTSLDEQSLRTIMDDSNSNTKQVEKRLSVGNLEATEADRILASLGPVSPPPISPPSEWKTADYHNDCEREPEAIANIQKRAPTPPMKLEKSKRRNSPSPYSNRRRSMADILADRRDSRTSPPSTPAPPPPLMLDDEPDTNSSHSRAFVDESVDDGHVSKDTVSREERSRTQSTESTKSPGAFPKNFKPLPKPPVPKKPGLQNILDRSNKSPVSNQDTETSSSSSATSASRPRTNQKKSDSPSRPPLSDERGSRMSLLEFDFPPPPPSEYSSQEEGNYVSLPNCSDVNASGNASVADSDGWGSEFSEAVSATNVQEPKSNGPSEKDLVNPKLQPFLVTKKAELFLKNKPHQKIIDNSDHAETTDSDGWGSEFSDANTIAVEKDLQNPKLQPFFVTPKTGDMTAVLPDILRKKAMNNNEHENISDSDDWGSEFSADITATESEIGINGPRTEDLQDPKLKPFLLNQNFESLKTERTPKDVSSSSLVAANESPTSAKKGKSSRFGFFGKKSETPPRERPPSPSSLASLFRAKKTPKKNDLYAIEARPKTALTPVSTDGVKLRKESLKSPPKPPRPFSMPPIPIPGETNSNLSRLTSRTELHRERSLTSVGYEEFSEPVSPAQKPHEQEYEPIENITLDRKSRGSSRRSLNPIPKPPRLSLCVSDESPEYMNLQAYRDDSSIAGKFDDSRLNGLHYEPEISSETVNFAESSIEFDSPRPLPPVPADDDDIVKCSRPLLNDTELNEMYATVDYAMKRRSKNNSLDVENDNTDSGIQTQRTEESDEPDHQCQQKESQIERSEQEPVLFSEVPGETMKIKVSIYRTLIKTRIFVTREKCYG